MDLIGKSVAVWFGWHVVAPVLFVLFIMVLIILAHVPRWIKQARCKHLHYHETSACDAICLECGLNLGFIGTVRDQRASPPRSNPND